MTRAARLLLLAALAGGAFLVGVELMITAVALPRIVPDLSDWSQLRHASWIVNGYLLAYIATMPLAGRAADRYGLPALFGAALALFALGSLLAGAAPDLDRLIGARILQGVGGGAIVPLATAGASHLFEGGARARALGVVGALTFLGMAVGPFAGAAILEGVDVGPLLDQTGNAAALGGLLTPAWRWIFYLGAPLALLGLVYTWATAPGWSGVRSGGRLDVVGAALFTLALAAGLLAVTTWGEASGSPLGSPLFAGVALVAALLAVLRFRTAPEPFLELALFRNRVFSSAVVLSLLTGYALATAIVGAAVFVDRVRYAGAEEQRLVLGALAGAMAMGALVSGFALRWAGPVSLSLAGLALSFGGLLVLSGAGPATSLGTVAVAVAVFGFGFGITVTPRSTAAVEAVGRRAFGVASASVTVARMMGMAIGLAVLTALGSNRISQLSVVLTDAGARDAVLPAYLRGRSIEDGLVVDALERWAATQAATILSGLFLVAAGVTLVAVIPALAMWRRGDRERAATLEDRADGSAPGRADGEEGEPALAL